MEKVKIDLDEGKILYEGEWVSEEDLKQMIKDKVDSGDFDVADLSLALKNLQKVMENSTVIEIRITREMEERIIAGADERGIKFGELVRRAIDAYLGGTVSAPETEEAEEEPEEEEGEEEEAVEEFEEKTVEEEEEEEEVFEAPEPEEEEEEERGEEKEEEEEDLFGEEEEEGEEEDLEIERIARRRRRRRR